ncbi:phenylalanine--tRNA ligase subunit beta [Fundicoccus culcitae]|uniref:Phenylalanine--tRNA ligase beta subunit n=1 Tax=Fundicoccus culcitae TaxID=2969821 RepID=A0ABY5P6N3_9LACT|nr:phenylalanine--tRNA ligase subunit beta [Fundicoccus culcitae]UUX34392.1 phenylalanine--tRNA ligase subunit beta [Fundicoccus culcitae]
MQLSMEWLNDFLDLSNWSGQQLADAMSLTGIEVEGVENFADNLSHLVVGQVVELAPMPESDHLKITQVDVGGDNLLQIVCGAPNVYQGAKVITAIDGAQLPGGIQITKTQLRGVESNGMLCSLQEIGFSDRVVAKKYADGIFILPEDTPIGVDVIEYLKLDDPILELSITPNRADALSMRGSAYEVGAIVEQHPQFELFETERLISHSPRLDDVTIEIESPDLSESYQLRLIENVTIKESPLWLQVRLMKAGIRPINNVVDATNYFLLLYGQPMHAFDYDQLKSKHIKVKKAVDGSRFTTLDGVERLLTANDVLIKADDEPIALAGVMGGLDSEVTDTTQHVLLETAVFNPLNVRQTSKQFNLRSESSLRFEKGINLATITESGEQAAVFIANLTAGQAVESYKEASTLEVTDKEIEVPFAAIKNKLGIEMNQDELVSIFDRLDFKVVIDNDSFTVTIPPRRWDINIEADVLEEIARIYGYDKIPVTLPIVPNTPGKLSTRKKRIRQIRHIFEGFGLNEVISYVLTSEAEAQLIHSNTYPFVKLAFPMSEERSILRQSLFASFLEIAQYNRARKNSPLAFYEVGKVFYNQGRNIQPIEAERLAIMLSGSQQSRNWFGEATSVDFYTIKGMLDTYFATIRLDKAISYQANEAMTAMHPGRTADIILDGAVIGFVGQIHPTVAKNHDLEDSTFFAELDLDAIFNYQTEPIIQSPIPKYPAISRDIALLVNDNQTHASLETLIYEQASSLLKSIELFDLYQGESIQSGKVSLAYHLTFQDPNRTLTDDDVNQEMTKITQALLTIDGLEIR